MYGFWFLCHYVVAVFTYLEMVIVFGYDMCFIGQYGHIGIFHTDGYSVGHSLV